ncbi:MAG: DUF3606 domain-containing protein [Candidatus Delongbacteria bacterium]|nr:DUF3606 domain-containing protein [Candidatus Delongbacteria bacterium]
MHQHNVETYPTNHANNVNIDIYNLYEVKKWCLDLEVTPYDLFIAFKKVGTSVEKIKEYFKN